jgi:FixJ family two-component response regulator
MLRKNQYQSISVHANRTGASCPGVTTQANYEVAGEPVRHRSLIAVVDDDESVRESLPELLKELGFAATAFASAEAFLTSKDLAAFRCLILDVSMPGMSGIDLQRELRRLKRDIPIVFITARADRRTLRTALIAQGAVECLFKPFGEEELRAALDAALGTP